MSFLNQNALSFSNASLNRASWTFSDDFSSYADTTAGDAAYPTSDTAKSRVNPTTDVLDFNLIDDSTNNGISHDLTTVSNTAWLLRMKVIFTSFSEPSDFTQLSNIGLSSTDYTAASNSAQDFVGLEIRKGVTASAGEEGWYTNSTDNANLNGAAINKFTYESGAISTQTIYLKIIRSSSTSMNIGFGTTSGYTDNTENKVSTISSSTTSLRYLSWKNQTNTGRNATMQGTADDIQFNNGVTTPP